jgi:hypothetical protein
MIHSFYRIASTCIISYALSGCVGAPLWQATRTDRHVVTVDDMRITVVRRDPDRYDATYFGISLVNNMLDIKDRQIRAVKLVSGCTVVSSEYMPGTVVLNTRVSCTPP